MASGKNYTEVLIGGKVFTLGGFESEEYLQKVSTYLNHNIADDYFKAKQLGNTFEEDIEKKNKEMYDLKHELITEQIKLENLQKVMEDLKEENRALQMKIVKLETEMNTRNK